MKSPHFNKTDRKADLHGVVAAGYRCAANGKTFSDTFVQFFLQMFVHLLTCKKDKNPQVQMSSSITLTTRR